MIERKLKGPLQEAAKYSPVIAILGPRQSGKTTLAKEIFNKHKYISLETSIGLQEYIKNDPKGFLEEHQNENGIILDEFQNIPSFLPYIEMAVNAKFKPGYFVLISSQNFLLNKPNNQTLAWHIAIFTLLPLEIDEFR